MLACLLLSACHEAHEPGAAGAFDAGASSFVDASRGSLDASTRAAPDAAYERPDARALLPPGAWSDCVGPASPSVSFQTLLDAQDFDASVVLVAFSGQNVLVNGVDGSSRLVTLRDVASNERPSFTQRSLPAGLTGLSVLENFVLACDAAKAECGLLSTTDTGTDIYPLANTTLPKGFRAHGLARIGATTCAFGSGLVCLDATGWVSVIDGLSVDDPIVAVDGDLQGALVTSASGRLWQIVIDPHSGTRSIGEQSKVEPGVSFVSFRDGAGYLSGPDALWCVDSAGAQRCDTDRGAQAALHASRTAPSQLVLTRAGDVLIRNDGAQGLGSPTAWCRATSLTPSGPLLAVGGAPCGAASNFRFLTAQKLVGQNDCILVP